MHRQVGDLQVDAAGVALRGLVVPHLVLPDGLAGTAEVMRFLAEEISRDSYVNVMDQYRPCHQASLWPLIARPLRWSEYRTAQAEARVAGLHRFAQ
jgi:putative pyruvate formate lyase activating enzyme